jgi:hypothetical protein
VQYNTARPVKEVTGSPPQPRPITTAQPGGPSATWRSLQYSGGFEIWRLAIFPLLRSPEKGREKRRPPPLPPATHTPPPHSTDRTKERERERGSPDRGRICSASPRFTRPVSFRVLLEALALHGRGGAFPPSFCLLGSKNLEG